jgi:hypothetical protein
MGSADTTGDSAVAFTQGDAVSSRIPSGVIGSIYDCTLDPSRWERTLVEITQAMSGESAILSLNDLRHDRLLIDKNVGWGQIWIEERQKHIPEIHARLNEWFAKGLLWMNRL